MFIKVQDFPRKHLVQVSLLKDKLRSTKMKLSYKGKYMVAKVTRLFITQGLVEQKQITSTVLQNKMTFKRFWRAKGLLVILIYPKLQQIFLSQLKLSIIFHKILGQSPILPLQKGENHSRHSSIRKTQP